MAKIVFLYFAALFGCVFVGGVAALAKCYSPCYWFLLIFPVSSGWLPIAMMLDLVSDHLIGTTLFTFSVFMLLVVSLILGAEYVNEKSFWGTVYVVSVFVSLLETTVIMLKLHARWILEPMGKFRNLKIGIVYGTDFLYMKLFN